MSALHARLQSDLNAARKAQDKARVLLLGTSLSEVKNRRIEVMRDLTDDDVVEVLQKSIKKRRESVEMYTNAGRTELAARESAEIEMLQQYLPAVASDDEIRAVAVEAIGLGALTIGPLMGKLVARFKGSAEGSRLSAIAREELAKRG